LLQGFASSEFCVMRTATYGLIAAARHSPVAVVSAIVENLKSNEKKKLHEAMPAYAVFALGDIGSPDAVEPLGKLLTHVKAVNVKRAIAEALGNIDAGGDGQESTLATITECLLRLSADGDAQTRFQATMSLAKVVGSLPSASAAERPELLPRVMRTLSNALFDNNRYVQAYAIEGLKRMRGCPEAQDLLIRTLSSQRWCPITNKDSAF
jgi:HEAT repeat protein